MKHENSEDYYRQIEEVYLNYCTSNNEEKTIFELTFSIRLD